MKFGIFGRQVRTERQAVVYILLQQAAPFLGARYFKVYLDSQLVRPFLRNILQYFVFHLEMYPSLLPPLSTHSFEFPLFSLPFPIYDLGNI